MRPNEICSSQLCLLCFHFLRVRAHKTAYLRNPDTNVFIVDWGKLSQLPCYPTASVNTKQAGECTARFLLKLKTLFGRDFMVRDIHAVGFSLGAHVAAFASNALEHHVGHRFDRITGTHFHIQLIVSELVPNLLLCCLNNNYN